MKAKTFRLTNETWQFYTTVRVGGTEAEAEKAFSIIMGEKPKALSVTAGTFNYREGEKSHMIWFKGVPTPGICAHEALHAVTHVMKEAGMGRLNDDNEEAFTYLLQWLVDEIMKRVVKFNEKPAESTPTDART